MKAIISGSVALSALIFTTSVTLADDFVIEDSVTSTNGGAVVGGDDTIVITKTGTVSANGGLSAFGGSNILINRGSVTSVFSGLSASGGSSTLINSGTVIAGSDGLSASGGFNSLLNSGTLTGDNGGLAAFGGSNTLINTGTMTVRSEGLLASGGSNTLINSGEMTTGDRGMFTPGDHNTITNSGTVTTTSSIADGLFAAGNNNSLSNSGTVTTVGAISSGISVVNTSNTLSNSGTVITNGDISHGLYAIGGLGKLNNSGKVMTSGAISHGIYASGDNNTLSNSGTVIAKQSRSIYLSGADGTVNLLEGSVLYGDVEFATATSAMLNFGAGLNASVNTPNIIPDKISVANGAYAVDGSTIHAVDAHSFAAGDLVPGVMGGMILDTLDAQVTANPVSVTRGTPATNKEWIQGFGGQRRHDGDSMTMAFTSKTYGMMAGRYLDSSSGVFAGVARNTTASDRTFDTESESIFAGYHTSYNLDDMAVEASLTFGVTQNESSRLIANNMVIGGLETATGDYTSYFLMPSASFKGDWALGNTGFEPSIRLRYAAIHDRGYTETGSAAAMTVDSRTSHLGEVRLQVERAMADHTIETGTLMSSLRLGFDTQYLHGDDISGTLAGQDITFTPDADNLSSRAFIGLNMAHLSDDGLRELRGSVEVGRASVGIADVSASLRWSMHF